MMICALVSMTLQFTMFLTLPSRLQSDHNHEMRHALLSCSQVSGHGFVAADPLSFPALPLRLGGTSQHHRVLQQQAMISGCVVWDGADERFELVCTELCGGLAVLRGGLASLPRGRQRRWCGGATASPGVKGHTRKVEEKPVQSLRGLTQRSEAYISEWRSCNTAGHLDTNQRVVSLSIRVAARTRDNARNCFNLVEIRRAS